MDDNSGIVTTLKESVKIVGIDDMKITELLTLKRNDIAQILPINVDFERYYRSIVTYIYKHPELKECSNSSLFVACVEAAEIGLDFNPQKGWAYIVKFGGEAQFLAGYRGYIELMLRSDKVSHVESHVVYEGDTFRVSQGTKPAIDHLPEVGANKRGGIMGAYCIVWLSDGTFQFEYMPKQDIDDIKRRARTQYIWNSDYGEMAKKTVVRRVVKYVSITPALAKLMEYDDNASGIADQRDSNGHIQDIMDDKLREIQEAAKDDVKLTPFDRFITELNITKDQAYDTIKRVYSVEKADNMADISDEESNHLITVTLGEMDRQGSIF